MKNNEYRKQLISKIFNGELPDRLPLSSDLFGTIEYKKDLYHLGEQEYLVKSGEIGKSADGTKIYTNDGGIWNIGSKIKYKTYTDVLDVDLSRFPIETVDEVMLSEMRRLRDEMAITKVPAPMHYGTLMSRAEIEFGWEPLLECIGYEPEKFGEILDRFGHCSLNVAEGWSRIDGIGIIVIHDDIAGTRGLIFNPTWLREYVFPWYKKIFQKIQENKKKVIYITDGNYSSVLDEIISMEPDGLYCESTSISPEFVMSKGGPDKFYIVKTNSRNIDHGSENDIYSELMLLKKLHRIYHKMWIYSGGGRINLQNESLFRQYYNELLVYTKN